MNGNDIIKIIPVKIFYFFFAYVILTVNSLLLNSNKDCENTRSKLSELKVYQEV